MGRPAINFITISIQWAVECKSNQSVPEVLQFYLLIFRVILTYTGNTLGRLVINLVFISSQCAVECKSNQSVPELLQFYFLIFKVIFTDIANTYGKPSNQFIYNQQSVGS